MLDWSKTSEEYVKFRRGFPPEVFEALEGLGLTRGAPPTLDLGTGTGAVAIELARRGLEVTGIDMADGQLVEARRRAVGLTAEFVKAPAEAVPFPAESFALVTAGQCWHWFDRPRAAAEALRVLVPGGHVAILHNDFLERPNTPPEIAIKLGDELGAPSPLGLQLGHFGLYPRWLEDLVEAGFRSVRSFTFDYDVSFSHEAWRGRMRSSRIAAKLSAEELERYDRTLAERIARFPDPFDVPHRIFVAFGTKPAD